MRTRTGGLRFRNWPLSLKMIGLLLVASSLPLGAAAYVAIRNASAQIRKDAARLLEARAEHLASELDNFHRGYVTSVTRFVEFPEVREFLLAGPAERQAKGATLRTVLEIHQRTDPNIR